MPEPPGNPATMRASAARGQARRAAIKLTRHHSAPLGSRTMTAPIRTLTLPDDGIIDLIAVEIAAQGTRPVALTHAERHLAAARILAAGGSLTDVCQRLHVSGTTALALAAHCQAAWS